MDNPIDGTDGKLGRGFMSVDKLEEIDIEDGDKPRPTFISANLDSSFKEGLIKLLKEYKDCFAWDYSEMSGLDRSIVEHRFLNNPNEFDFGADPDEPEPENQTTEQPLSGPASSLVITSTPAGRFVYWPDRKPADLTDGNSRCVAYLDSLPFQEGTPLAPAEEHTPTEVATSDSILGSPDRQVFMTINETPGPSWTQPDRFLEDISADELSANAPADETDANKNARRERNRRRNERRRRLRESLPIRNLAEAPDQVENRMHTTPEQCLMSITTIAHQAQGMRAGEVIAKLAEDAYFMRVDNRVAQVPPVRNRQPDNEATSRSPANNGRNHTRGELPANPNHTQASASGPSQGGNSAGRCWR
jgi:hypothetical protein